MSVDGEAGRGDPVVDLGRLVAGSLTAGDATGWFEPLYAAAEQGVMSVPWDQGEPHWLLARWADRRGLDGTGRQAIVVGCGLGDDAEHFSGRGFATTAFDISPSAVRTAQQRFPGSRVDYRVADLLDPPGEWREAFDLVVESQTIQALPDPPRREAIRRVAGLVAPGGTLIVVALARDEADDPGQWPPWPITRAEIDAFTAAGLTAAHIENVSDGGPGPVGRRWVAEFQRPRGDG